MAAIEATGTRFGRTRAALSTGLLVLASMAAACAPSEPSLPTPAPAVAAEPRHAVRPVPVDARFEAAIQRGTRTATGYPGEAYWTNRVDYRIDARLDPATAELEGEQTVTYHNNSPDTLRVVVARLYQNLFSAGVPRNRHVPMTGGMELRRIAVGGRVAEPARPGATQAGPSYRIVGTMLYLRLAEPLPPGGQAMFDFAWRFEVPPAGAPRHGHLEHRVYNVAQWYPQIAVYDDLQGWHTWPYLGDGEFYLDYGDFEVSLTLPEGWVVAATGELVNAEDVLPPDVRARLDQALRSDSIVRIVTREGLGAGRATSQAPGGELTWRFRAQNVRDFAFATSDEYLWDASRAVGPDSDRDADARPDTIAVHALYTADATHWRDAARFVRHAVEYHAGQWHPYPWPHMTGAMGPVGGMEYPMLTFVAAFNSARLVYTVLNHEIGHMWYPMMVGSNEASYPWMDEGLTTYIENYASSDFFDDELDWRQSTQSSLQALASPDHTPIMRHADLHGPTGTRGASSYHKPAVLLRALEGVIGREAVWRSLREYADAWLYRHPAPQDFFNLVEHVAGRDLDWFWYPWFYETVGMDQAIADVRLSDDGRRASVTIEDQGAAPMPIRLDFTLEDGSITSESVPVDVWLDGARIWTGSFELDGPVTAVELDAGGLFPEVDRSDNTWRR